MSEAPNELLSQPPQMIEGRYRIVRDIAEGGMATVYQAVDERLGRTVAIKVMHTQLAQGPHRDQFVERFRREANSAAAIANPHVVQVYDTGEFNGRDFLVMEYVHGVNLRHEMNTQRTFSVRETLRIIAETLDGLSSAHRAGVVHRDIKPENILINDRGHVQITDFGLAKAASQATLSSTGMLLGTAAYLAPEMIEHNQATPQGDLYSVGIMAWEMLAGRVPFESDNPVTLVFKHVHEDVPPIASVCPDVDPQVSQFISHLTARAVEARPADGTAAAQELQRIASALSAEALQYRRHIEQGPHDSSEIGDETDDKTIASPILPHDGEGRQTAAPPTPPVAQTTPFQAQTQLMESGRARNETQVLAQSPTAETPDATDVDAPVRKNPRHRKPLIIALVVMLVLAITGSGAGWWWFAGPGSYWSVPMPEGITCTAQNDCSLAGAEWSAYESTLKVAGIPYEAKQEFSDNIDEGDIVSASIGDADAVVGSHISKRSHERLTVVVSKGMQMATIPADILDANSANGKDPLTALKNAGFSNIRHDSAKDEYSLDRPEGTVLSISPDPGTTGKHNIEVTITLSKGPMPVSMPDIVGKSQGDMQTSFDELKLKANVTEQFDDKIPAGTVISASQQAGAQLKWGDSVDVVVSKGPETTIMPNVVGQQYDDAAKQLEALGFTVKKSAPLFDITHVVRMQNPKAGDSVRLRDENGAPTVVTLTVV